MEEQLLALLRKLPLDPKTLRTVLPLVSRFGASGVNALARGYLGDLAEPRCPCPTGGQTPTPPPPAPPPPTNPDGEQPVSTAPPPTETRGPVNKVAQTKDGLDSELVGRALHKLAYELGELALHNPGVDPAGKLPTYQRDADGALPSVSVAHAIAAKRWYDQRDAAAAAERVDASPRGRVLAARSQRYAAAPRYSYVVPTTFRGSR